MESRCVSKVRYNEDNSYIFFKMLTTLFVSLTLIYKIGNIENKYYPTLLACSALIFTFLSLFKCFVNKKRELDSVFTLGKFFFILFLLIQVFLEVYAIFLLVIGKTERIFISTNLQSILAPFYFISIVYLFKKDSLNIILWALIINFYLCFFVNIFTYGISGIIDVFNAVINGNIGSDAGHAFEVHDNSFAMGFFFIFLILNPKYELKYKRFILFSLFVGIFFGQKRIEFLAIVIVLALWFLNSLFGVFTSKLRYYILFLLMIIAYFFCFAYVKMSISGKLTDLLSNFNINMMGRNYFYDLISNYCTFSIRYVGMGKNSAGLILSTIYPGYGVSNLHNDILKMYFENGFIMFSILLGIYLFVIPIFSIKKYSYRAGIKNILIIIFLFICYSTDNIDAYIIVQVSLLIILLFNCIMNKDNK